MEQDPTGLYHAGARQYSPVLMRFLNEDPERGKANMYTYAGNDAIAGSDVSGMDDARLAYGAYQVASSFGATSGDGGTVIIVNAPQLVQGILNILFSQDSADIVPNYQRFQNERMFGRYDESIGIVNGNGPMVLSQSDNPCWRCRAPLAVIIRI